MWPFGNKKDDQAPGDAGAGPGSAVRADMLWRAGSKYLSRKQYDKAIASLEEAFTLQPSRLEGRLNLGAALYLVGRPEEAVGHLKYVLAFDPQNTVALLNLAAAYDALGELEKSVESLEKLVGDRPNWADANYNLAVAYLKQDRLEDATLALRRELTLNPKHEAARTLLNEVHLKPRRKKAPPMPEAAPPENALEAAPEAEKPEPSADNS